MLAKSSSAQSRGRKPRIGGSAMRGCWKWRREALFEPSRRTTQEFLLEMPAGGDDSLFEGHRKERLLGTRPLDRQGEDMIETLYPRASSLTRLLEPPLGSYICRQTWR